MTALVESACPKCKRAVLLAGQVLCGGCSKLDTGKQPFPRELLTLATAIEKYGARRAVQGLADVLDYGAKKYAIHSWRTVPDARERYFSALMRHLEAYARGEAVDPESGLPHLDHVLCNVFFLRELNDG